MELIYDVHYDVSHKTIVNNGANFMMSSCCNHKKLKN